MANPKATYGANVIDDCTAVLTTTAKSGITNESCACLYQDLIKITGDAAGADAWVYYEKTISASLTSTHPHFVIRYKTSVPAVGLGAKVVLVYGDAHEETLIGGSSPLFSSSLKVVKGELTYTGSQTLSKIRYYGVSDAAETGKSVYYDFLLVAKDEYTLPNKIKSEGFEAMPVLPKEHASGSIGDNTQPLGCGDVDLTIEGEIDTGADWYGSEDSEYYSKQIPGEVLYEFLHDTGLGKWAWVTTDMGSMKMYVSDWHLGRSGEEKAIKTFRLVFSEVRRSSASHESAVERFGLIT